MSKTNRVCAAWAALLTLVPQPGIAEPVLSQDRLSTCVAAQIAANAPVADCVNDAHATCLDYVSQAPVAAVQCFRQAKTDWAKLLSEQIAGLRTLMEEEPWTILEINARYDLMGNLVQCDRMIELMTLRTQDGEVIELQKARCQATASGLAYMKLALQTQAEKDEK